MRLKAKGGGRNKVSEKGEKKGGLDGGDCRAWVQPCIKEKILIFVSTKRKVSVIGAR